MRNKLVTTENVALADKIIERLGCKESPGMILIDGKPGTGKSHYCLGRTFSHGWSYYRIQATSGAKSFLQEVYKRLNKVYTGSDEVMRGSTAKLENACIEMFQRMSDHVLVIDETNLCVQFRKWDIIEVIRDFRDVAHAKIIMIGEHDTRAALESYNSHFFSRCEFINFKPNSIQDVATIIKTCSDVEFEKDIYSLIVKKFAGNLHEVTKFIEDAEVTARQNNLAKIGIKDLEL